MILRPIAIERSLSSSSIAQIPMGMIGPIGHLSNLDLLNDTACGFNENIVSTFIHTHSEANNGKRLISDSL